MSTTHTQREALFGTLIGVGAYRNSPELSSDPNAWIPGRRMGGARARCVDSLERDGLLFSIQDKAARAEFNVFGRKVSVRGLRELESYFARRKFDPTDGRLQLVRDAIPAQAELETKVEQFLQDRRDAANERYRRVEEAQRKARLESLRLAFAKFGLDRFASELVDEELIAFADEVEGARHGTRAYRHMTDDDLSAALDELQKTATVPGSIGDKIKFERIAAINESFAARAGADQLQEAE